MSDPDFIDTFNCNRRMGIFLGMIEIFARYL